MMTTRFTLALLAVAVVSPAAFAGGPQQPTPAEQAFNLRMDGGSDEAKALLQRTLAETQDDASAWFELARTEFYHFQFDDAAQAIAKATELAPENARYHYFVGMTATYNAVSKAHSAETRNQVELESGKALAAFQRAVNVDPDFHDARIQLINMLVKTSPEQGGSLAIARKQVEVLESKDAVYGVEGRCMLVTNNEPTRAIDLWEQAVATHATRADAHAGLAEACLRAGDIDRAVTHIDKAIQLDPSHCTILLALCRRYVSEDDGAAAQQAVERYLHATPSPPVPLRSYATFCLAQLERMQGNEEHGEALLAEAKQLDPRCWMTYMEPPEALFDTP